MSEKLYYTNSTPVLRCSLFHGQIGFFPEDSPWSRGPRTMPIDRGHLAARRAGENISAEKPPPVKPSNQVRITLEACSPLGPWATSNLTSSP